MVAITSISCIGKLPQGILRKLVLDLTNPEMERGQKPTAQAAAKKIKKISENGCDPQPLVLISIVIRLERLCRQKRKISDY